MSGKRGFDLDGLVVYVRFLSVEAKGGSSPAKPAAPAGPGAATAPGGEAAGEEPPIPDPASLDDQSVFRCDPLLVLPGEPPEKPRSSPASTGAGQPRMQRCESSEAVCILNGAGGISCWPKKGK